MPKLRGRPTGSSTIALSITIDRAVDNMIMKKIADAARLTGARAPKSQVINAILKDHFKIK